MTVSHPSYLKRQHLMTRIQPFLYPVYSKMNFRSSRWNMTTKCRSCSVIPSTMFTAKVRRHHGFLLLTVSYILLGLVRYTATCYWYHVFSPQQQPICLSVRHIRPTCCYIIVSRSRLSRQILSCVLEAIEDFEGLAIRQKLRTHGMSRWGIRQWAPLLQSCSKTALTARPFPSVR